jgi:glyoxylase-like metal-dependent hydrolase (beta-lactamase superfamily II)
MEEAIREGRERLKTETDPRWIASLERSLRNMGQRLETLPLLELQLPAWTFSGSLEFYGTRRRAELLEVTPAHTAHELYLLLPEDHIAFIGDLGFFQCQPYMAFCEPQAWIEQIERLEQAAIEILVPGHGPLGTKADLALQKQYIAILPRLVVEAITEGLSPGELIQRDLPPPFQAWLHGGMLRWEANVHALYERLSSGVGT